MKNKFLKYFFNGILLMVFITICFFINQRFDIKGLFIDDLKTFSYFPESNIFTYAFKFYKGATRYRPVYDFFQFIAFTIAGHNPHVLYIINILINGMIAFAVYKISYKFSKNYLLSFFTGIIYIVSHFSCYQITQATGLMESIATFLSLLILKRTCILVSNYTIKEQNILFLLLFLIVFTHERYLSYFVVIFTSLLIVYVLKKNMNATNGMLALLLLGIVVITIRFFATKSIIPAGTSNTLVTETFTVSTCINKFIESILYLLGINSSNEAMCGMPFYMVKDTIKGLIYLQISGLIFLFLIHFVNKTKCLKDKSNEKLKVANFIDFYKIDIVFILMILLCVFFSSVTVFIEMRFILVPFIITFIYINYIFGEIARNGHVRKITLQVVISIVIFITFVLRFIVENHYRQGLDNVYYMIDQRRVNALADVTVNKYGNDILDEKNIVIIDNNYLYTQEYLDLFFQFFQKNYEERPIITFKTIDKLKNSKFNTKNSIILREEIRNNNYIEILKY